MKILNFGSLNIDYVYTVDHMVIKGETEFSDSRATFPGGKGLNQSVAMARAGLEVYHAGNIGSEGVLLKELLESAGVNTTYVRILQNMPSGHTIIQNDKDGDNCILLFGGANRAVTKEQIDATLGHFAKGDVCVLQNEISNIPYLVEKAHEREMTIVLNPSPMDRKIMALPLEYVSLLFVNEIEAQQLLDAKKEGGAPNSDIDMETAASSVPSQYRKMAEALLKTFPNMKIVLTLGGDGSAYIDMMGIQYQECVPTKAVDTTAAGDTFSGYFLEGILSGMKPKEALRLASKAASIAVSRKGASSSIPKRKEVMIQRNTPQ